MGPHRLRRDGGVIPGSPSAIPVSDTTARTPRSAVNARTRITGRPSGPARSQARTVRRTGRTSGLLSSGMGEPAASSVEALR